MIARNLTCRSIAFIPCGRVESNIMLSPSFSTNSFSPIRRCMLPSRTRLNSCPGWVLSVNGASGADGSTVTMKGSALRLANPAANDWYLQKSGKRAGSLVWRCEKYCGKDRTGKRIWTIWSRILEFNASFSCKLDHVGIKRPGNHKWNCDSPAD